MIGASEPDATGTPRRIAIGKYLGVAVASIALLVGAAIPAAAAELMTVTFVRHAQSEGNASGLIDTKVPGPHLTELGQQQAKAVVGTLGNNNYDSIYASTMVRTQETAAPMSQYLRLPVQILPGIQEIEAGSYEGTPESQAATGYAVAPIKWLRGDLTARIDGTTNTVSGTEFDARMDAALKTIYDNGDRNPIVFSHGGAIMFWTMLNVSNLTLIQKFTLLQTASLKNTDYVVIQGNPTDGWVLVNWNGQQFSTAPTLESQVALQVRTLSRQLATSAQQVVDSLKTGDITKVVAAINQSSSDAGYSLVKFGRNVGPKIATAVNAAVADFTTRLRQQLPGSSTAAKSAQTSVSASAKSRNSAASKASDGAGSSPKAGSAGKSTGGSGRHRDAA